MATIVIVASSSDSIGPLIDALHRLTTNLEALTTTNLMDGYAVIEERMPELVLVAPAFLELPEYEMMDALFRATGTRWLRLPCDLGSSASAYAEDGALDRFIREATAVIGGPWNAAGHVGKLDPPGCAQERKPEAGGDAPFVLLGASTGGIDALREVLSGFPEDCPPTFIVQHTGSRHCESLRQVLDRVCPARVMLGVDGLRVLPGMVVLQSGEPRHLTVNKSGPLRVVAKDGPPISGHLPSADALFLSARGRAPQVVAGLLTGMGRDGAQGLSALHQGGAATFVQDEESSLVYGMPKAAWSLGAADAQVPLSQISAHILRLCRRTKPPVDPLLNK